MQTPRTLLGLVFFLWVPACSLVAGLSGLVGPGADDAGAEGGVDDSGGADGAQGSSDGGAHLDAEAAAPFCSVDAGRYLCADFDEGALATGWGSSHQDPRASIGLSTTRYVSPSASFHATIDRRAALDLEYALLEQKVTAPWRRTVMDFDIFLEQPAFQGGDVNAALLAIDFQGGSSALTVYLTYGQGYCQVNVGASVSLDITSSFTTDA